MVDETMSGVRQMVAALKAEIASPRYRPGWETAQLRHPVLRRIADIHTVLKILGDLKKADLRHKDIITRAIISEHKAHPGPFWTAVLLLAYSPMLGGLRGRIFGDAFDREDLDQLVVDAFLSVVRGFPLIEKRSRTFLHLKQFTSSQVFRIIRSRQNEIKEQQRLINLAQKLDEFDLFGEVETIESDVDRDEMAELLWAVSAGREPFDNVQLVVDTVIYRKKLTDYVNEKFPTADPEQQERVYCLSTHQETTPSKPRSIERHSPGHLLPADVQGCPQST